MPEKPTYIGLIMRSVIVLVFQSMFRISPFNFRSHPNASITDLVIMIPLLIGTYSLLIGYAFQAVIRIGTVADEYPNSPFHEKLIAIIVLAVVILLYIYICLTTPPGIPWYME